MFIAFEEYVMFLIIIICMLCIDDKSIMNMFGKQMTLCTELDRRIQKMEEEILVNPLYVKKSSGTTDEDIASAQSAKMSYLM